MPKKTRSALSLNFLSIAAILATALPAATSPAKASAFNFTQLDAPNATLTRALGINDAAQIVGDFRNSTGTHGFLDTGGSFTPLDVPGATTPKALRINDAAQIVGVFTNSPGSHGFLDTGGRLTTPHPPPPPPATAPRLTNGAQLAT